MSTDSGSHRECARFCRIQLQIANGSQIESAGRAERPSRRLISELRWWQAPSKVACASEEKAGETPALTRNRMPTGRAGTPEGATYPELPPRLRPPVSAAVGLG